MEAGLARYRDDSPRLPTLSLGLSSVRFIVNKLEAEYTRVIPADAIGNGHELVKYDPNIDEGYDDDDSSLDRSRGRVWNRFVLNLGVALSRCIPSVTFGNFGVLAVVTGLIAPKMLSYLVVYPFCRLIFGTLYPAYASYKAVRTKNLKEYVKWMMYWIVFALFTCTETFTDMFLSWFPFYYEVKIVLVLWLLSPATKGSSILYRKFVHPALCRREQEIDEYIAKAKDQGYHTVLNLGTKGVNYATSVIMQTAIKGGGGLVQQLRKSYSLSDLSECEPREERGSDEADDVLTEQRLIRKPTKSGYNTRRSASESNSRSPMYFPEVDVDVRGARPRTDEPDFSHIKSTEDISSGYSSGDTSASLTRTASLGAAARARAKSTRTTVTTIKRPQAAEDNEVIVEEQHEDDTFEYANMPPLVKAPSPLYLSHSEPPFLYRYVGDKVQIVKILGNYPLSTSSNDETNNTDSRDQKEVTCDEAILKTVIIKNDCKAENIPDDTMSIKNDVIADIPDKTESNDINDENSVVFIDGDALTNKNIEIKQNNENNPSIITENRHESNAENKEIVNILEDNDKETISLDAATNDMESAESDDEASFGTPDDSPKSKRKAAKGKYGKPKAPPPPPPIDDKVKPVNNKIPMDDLAIDKVTAQESLAEIVKNLPNTSFKESGQYTGMQVVNPIAEKKIRHKSKSPGIISKGNSYGISKLLQLPSKLAFWQKAEDKMVSDSVSTSSDDQSGKLNVENVDDYQSCSDLNVEVNTEASQVVVTNDPNSFKDGLDVDNENITRDIKEKSDVLQKLIDAKIENHPEYKINSVHEKIMTSKSTDV